MPQPVIGITVDNLQNSITSGRYDVGIGYSRAVAQAGGVPVLLPHEVSRVESYVAMCDGLILTGGVDPDTAALPADWPGAGPIHPAARRMDPTRQVFELNLLEHWLTHRPTAPLLGICLGMQLLTLYHGGLLNQYLPDDYDDQVVQRHRDSEHGISTIAPDSVLPQSDEMIRSHHQQAISDPGSLRVVAVAEDGIIEAVDQPGHPFLLGVQWHPERGDIAANSPLSAGLIERFVTTASATLA